MHLKQMWNGRLGSTGFIAPQPFSCVSRACVCNTNEEKTCRIKVVVQGQVLSLLHGDGAGRTDKRQEAVEDEAGHC